MFPLFLGCSYAENAEHATNQTSASPPPPWQNDSVCSPSCLLPAKRRYLNFMLPLKSTSPLPSKSNKSELIG